MGNLSRCKGRRGEQELARLLADALGSVVARNLMQSRDGGHDLLELEGWSIEVKRAAQPRLTEWWQQAVAQATATGSKPVLAYRLDRQPWRFVVALRGLLSSLKGQSPQDAAARRLPEEVHSGAVQ